MLVFPVRRGEKSLTHLVTLGRTTNNDIVVSDISVSRFHAFMKEGPNGDYQVLDGGSTNGTTVNGAFVASRGAGGPTTLKAGDNLRLGQVEFTFVDAEALRNFALEFDA